MKTLICTAIGLAGMGMFVWGLARARTSRIMGGSAITFGAAVLYGYWGE